MRTIADVDTIENAYNDIFASMLECSYEERCRELCNQYLDHTTEIFARNIIYALGPITRWTDAETIEKVYVAGRFWLDEIMPGVLLFVERDDWIEAAQLAAAQASLRRVFTLSTFIHDGGRA